MPYPNYQQPINFSPSPYTPAQYQMQNPYSQNQYSNVQGQSPLMNPSSGIIWVQGEVGARAYPVGAGNSVLLMDSDDKYFYIKSADMSGMPKLHKYYYSEVIDEVPRIESHDTQQNYDTADLASRDEVKNLQEEIHELKEQIKSLEAMNNNKQQQRGKQNGQ